MRECEFIAVEESKNVKLAKDLLLNLAGRSVDPTLLRRALDAVSDLEKDYDKRIVIEVE